MIEIKDIENNSMYDWAKNEVMLACKKENPNHEDEWDYGAECYKSALKAYASLCEDGHSGYSFSVTRHILERLIAGCVLTPIEDVDDSWGEPFSYGSSPEYISQQCKRKYSLFKKTFTDGTVKYFDNDRMYCQDADDENNTFHCGFIFNIVDELVPITFPYMPDTKPIRIIVKSFCFDPKFGDVDTFGIFKAFLPNKEMPLMINRFFKETENGIVEIDEEEFKARHASKIIESRCK